MPSPISTAADPRSATTTPAASARDDTRRFGRTLRGMRLARHQSQKALALDADVDQSVLAALESGRRPAPRAELISRLACALGATPAERKELELARLASRLAAVLAAEPILCRTAVIEVALALSRALRIDLDEIKPSSPTT